MTQQFEIDKDFLCLYQLKSTTIGEGVKAVKATLEGMNLQLESRMVNVTMDGAGSMVGENKGIVTLIEKGVVGEIRIKFVKLHCIMHQQVLCAKSASLNDVMSLVIKDVNFILSRCLNHKPFREMLKEIDSEYGDLLYFWEVRWLSKAAMLQHVYQLRPRYQIHCQKRKRDSRSKGS